MSSPLNTESQTSSSSNSQKFNISITDWGMNVIKQIDDSLPESTNKMADVLAYVAREEKIITENKIEEKIHGFPDLDKTVKAIHNHAKFIAAWGLLFTRLSNNAFAQRQYILFLTHLEQACMHLDQSISKVSQTPMFVDLDAPKPSDTTATQPSEQPSTESSTPILLSTSNMKQQSSS